MTVIENNVAKLSGDTPHALWTHPGHVTRVHIGDERVLRVTRGHGARQTFKYAAVVCWCAVGLGKMLLCLILDHPDKDLVFTRLALLRQKATQVLMTT